ncbi:MAG: filamentous hemagglutinin N-terminal domain-containing protein [Xenococcaceae cyanobacterium MO_188.B32]|nr:filamentous hemagglutinin N-terminal domain-containing protein [Xenococcaceae cyanobacterium MO_188.B32]
MFQQPWRFIFLSSFAAGGILGSLGNFPSPVLAQITPDSSLGNEKSVVTPNVFSDKGLIDRIDGGAIRSNALFHSFQDFNVNQGQQVYFANPEVINNIFSRVTGVNASEIFGTLGVLGNANLYLINPNGILFGTDAQLDVRGSFVGSTSNSLVFDNGYNFSAVNPDAPPLLAVTGSQGLSSWLPPTSGNIASTGKLSVGENLTLAGNTLDLQGELQAGGDLTLQATDILTIRDNATNPFIAAAGNELLLQGDRTLDIFALNHPDSGLYSLSDLVLRSDDRVIGDAHFFAGGNFRVEQLDGSPGILTSPNDPIVRANGDVIFDSYTGASLHILAGGSVEIGEITIEGSDTEENSLQEQVILSDSSTTVNIDGNAEPTLDIRAGTLAVNTPGLIPNAPDGLTEPPTTDGTGTNANINIESINNPGGLVFLSNQYQPNTELSGDIGVGSVSTATDPTSGLDGGSVVMDSRGGITFNDINVSGAEFDTFFTSNVGGNGGDVTLLAQNDIFMPFPSTIISDGLRGGNITLFSNTAIIHENAPLGSFQNLIRSDTFDHIKGGDIRLTAPSMAIESEIFTNIEDGEGGDIFLTADSLVADQSTIATFVFGSGTGGNTIVKTDSLALTTAAQIGSVNSSFIGGQGGNVVVEANSISAEDGGQILSVTFGLGNAGDINVTARDISLSGFRSEDLTVSFGFDNFSPTAIRSSVDENSEGNSGNVTIATDTLSITDGAAVQTTSFGIGNAGNIDIEASQSILVDGAILFNLTNRSEPSTIASEIFEGAAGQGGDITITTPVLDVTNGGTITAVSVGDGDAGSIDINATQSVSIDGVVVFENVDQFDPIRESEIAVFTAENSTGDGGTLTLTTPSLSLTNNGRLTASTLNIGDAGDIILNVSDNLFIDGEGSGILSNTFPESTGQGGSISIESPLVRVQNDGSITVDSQGTGIGGEIFITSDQLQLFDRGLISAEAASNDGGNITLNLDSLLLLRNQSNISATAGTARGSGDGGNIRINMPDGFIASVLEEDNNISANAFEGDGGNIDITALEIFGIEFQEQPTPFSDITASSEFGLQGTVTIEITDVDPSDDLVELPTGLVDASRLVARGCGAGADNTAAALGEFTITGRGGFPPTPGQLSPHTSLAAWETLDSQTISEQSSNQASTLKISTAPQPTQIVEFQGWVINEDGSVTLTADASTATPHTPWEPNASCKNSRSKFNTKRISEKFFYTGFCPPSGANSGGKRVKSPPKLGDLGGLNATNETFQTTSK